jgi:glycosyltransferase involved in cell wall biosynthesis
MSREPHLSVVIPVHCEEGQIPEVIGAVHVEFDALALSHEIVVVDDGSTDGTWARLEALTKADPGLSAIRLSRRFGKESALSAGLDVATGDAVIVMDGDMQHPPALIPALVAAWRDGADVAEGVKQERGQETGSERLFARLFYASSHWLTGYDLRQVTDYKLMDRRVLEQWRELGERNLYFRGMVAWLGFRRVGVPFRVADRSGGERRWSLAALVGLALTAITAFSTMPLRAVTLFGGLFFLLSLALGLQTLFRWASGTAVSGFTTVILLQLVSGSLILIGLGVAGEYIARIYHEVKGRPRYIADRCIGARFEEGPDGTAP